jgi:hypothetical protein
MCRPSGQEPVGDDELVYRRVPVSCAWYLDGILSPDAFDPRPADVDGLSVYRASFVTMEQAAQGPSKHGYYLAVLAVGGMRAQGIRVEPDDPDGTNPGHAKLPDLNAQDRRTTRVKEFKEVLARTLVLRVEGPFVAS